MSYSSKQPCDHQQKQPICSTGHCVASLGIATQDVSTCGGVVEVYSTTYPKMKHVCMTKRTLQGWRDAWQLEGLPALPEDLSSFPRTLFGNLTTTRDSSSRRSNTLLWPLQAPIHEIHINKNEEDHGIHDQIKNLFFNSILLCSLGWPQTYAPPASDS